MCIRDREDMLVIGGRHSNTVTLAPGAEDTYVESFPLPKVCLLYTSDAADERSSVDLGGRRIIKKKKHVENGHRRTA
mgnify:CR=1 FL=1